MPCVLLLDETAARLHTETVGRLITGIAPLGVLEIQAGEACKSLARLTEILDFLAENGLPKHGIIIAVGGGTVCDVANTAANLFRRGVGLALVPTTLLAQIDAAIGGKNGLNFRKTKNLLGHFYHAQWVICDVRFLRSLDRLQATGGFAEAIKVLAVSDAAALRRHFAGRPPGVENLSLDALLELVAKCVDRKLVLLDSDPFELSSRRLLNYGHAFAHTFEEESGFSLTHGEAVLMGMTVENTIAMELGLTTEYVDYVQSTVNAYMTENCLRYWLRGDIVLSLVDNLKAARRDQMNLVCLTTPGNAEIVDSVSDDIILSAWNKSLLTVERSLRKQMSA